MLTALKQPSHVRFAKHQLAASLTVEWKRPGCGESGYIEQFIVTACLRAKRDCDCLQGDGNFSLFVDV